MLSLIIGLMLLATFAFGVIGVTAFACSYVVKNVLLLLGVTKIKELTVVITATIMLYLLSL